MEDIFDDMFDTSQALAGVDAEVGKNLSEMVKQVTQLDKKINDWEEHLKILKEQRKRITHDRIPSLMDEMGVEKSPSPEKPKGCIVFPYESVWCSCTLA